MPPTGGRKPPFGSSALFPRTELFVSERLPPAFSTPPTAMLKTLSPPGALAVFSRTVLLCRLTRPPGPEFRMPPIASLGAPVALLSETVLLISLRLLGTLALNEALSMPRPLW